MNVHLICRDVAAVCLRDFDKLGAMTGKDECRYTYEDGSHCAIGQNLPSEALASLTENDQQLPFDSLSFEITSDDRNLLTVIQDAHDGLTVGGDMWEVRSHSTASTAINTWLQKHRDYPITRENYREFLELVAAS